MALGILLAGPEAGSLVAGGGPGASPPRLISLKLQPSQVQLAGPGASQRFLLTGVYADGVRRDLTRRSRFRLSDSRIAGLIEPGRVAALETGEVVLTGEFEGRSARAEIRIRPGRSSRPFSFARDVGGILTKRGCNNQECHGSVKGRGGFKLSANALYPKDDYGWIVEGGVYQVLSPEPLGRRQARIDLKQPENSLLLTKSTMETPHGGGERLSRGSADYRTLVQWIRAGAPYGGEEDRQARRIHRLEVAPRQPVMGVGGEQQLLVTATLAGGRREDVTDQVNFESNDPEVVEVTDGGLVRARQPGETAVVIRAAGRAATVLFGVIGQPLADYPQVSQRNFIDRLVFAKLRRLHILPSEPSDDRQFLRRVCLDLTGTLPPPERVREFLASHRPDKRDELIETLLNSPEFLDYWTFRFADLFRVGKAVPGFTKYSRLYWEWIRDGIARNKPYDQMARERIAAQGYGGPALHYYLIGGDLPSPQNMMGEQVRVFLGRRLDCAQCHNHPYEPWSQNQFWGMTAFYGQLTRVGDINTATAPYNIIMDEAEGHGVMGKGGPVIHPRNKAEVRPAFLTGEPAGQNGAGDPRASLAEWMTSPDRPEFAEAIVNRIWGHFFGRGIVDPVDDFKLANPATHPDLLAALAEDFRDAWLRPETTDAHESFGPGSISCPASPMPTIGGTEPTTPGPIPDRWMPKCCWTPFPRSPACPSGSEPSLKGRGRSTWSPATCIPPAFWISTVGPTGRWCPSERLKPAWGRPSIFWPGPPTPESCRERAAGSVACSPPGLPMPKLSRSFIWRRFRGFPPPRSWGSWNSGSGGGNRGCRRWRIWSGP